WMEAAGRLGAEEGTLDPPQAVMDNVLSLGRHTARLKRLRNAIVALLTFDSFNEAAPAGVRRGEAGSPQLTYEVDDTEIGIWMRHSGERTLTLTGQVLDKSSAPIQDPSAHADLVVEGDHIRTAALSEWGEFVFNEVPKGQYGLEVFFLD